MHGYVRNDGTCYRASCTCLMGSHAIAIVDDALEVHGLDGLRVIDASLIPAVTSTNTNAPTIMIAEKVAAAIKGARERLAAQPLTHQALGAWPPSPAVRAVPERVSSAARRAGAFRGGYLRSAAAQRKTWA